MATYTQLSVTATPGGRYSFSPKAPAGEGSHEGLFTALSVIALPGVRHVFLPKEFVEPIPERDSGGGRYFTKRAVHYARRIKEDKEMLDVIIQSFIAGIFDD